MVRKQKIANSKIPNIVKMNSALSSDDFLINSPCNRAQEDWNILIIVNTKKKSAIIELHLMRFSQPPVTVEAHRNSTTPELK